MIADAKWALRQHRYRFALSLIFAPILLMLAIACTQPTNAPAPLTVSNPANSPAVSPTTTCTYQHAANGAVLPDPNCTPGATNPDVTQDTIGATICKRGWTTSVRPPVSVTEPQKFASMKQYGATGSASGYEYDHLVPLEIGGALDDPKNLWPEPGNSPNVKDTTENQLNKLVCNGKMSLIEAQMRIAKDWTAAVP